MRKIVCASVALLFVGLFVASVECQKVGNYVISPTDEAIEKIQLATTDSVVGNMSVSNGFVYFYVTNPSYDIVYQSLKTSFDSFNFTANESGIYVMHFANRYQSEDVNVTLSYARNLSVVIGETVHISGSATTTFTSGSVTITRVQPYLLLDVSPLGFPVVGQFWKLSVYYQVTVSDGIQYYSPMPNATVEVKVDLGNQTKGYWLITDEDGQTEFQSSAEFVGVSFQAVSGGNRSDIIALSQRAEHYVSADIVDFTIQLSGTISGAMVVASAILFHFRKRVKVFFRLLLVAVFCLSSVQLVFSAYSRLFMWTPWGYPENIFGFFTWTVLRYASFGGMLIAAVLGVLAFFLKSKGSEPQGKEG